MSILSCRVPLRSEIKQQVTSSWSLSLVNYQDDARSNKHKITYIIGPVRLLCAWSSLLQSGI